MRPSGTVTFLFTDIEGSTRRWELDAPAMAQDLSAHDDVLVRAVGARGGWLFKHTGDGICAAFASPQAAIDAAVDAQQGLSLPVRIGIGTGEATVAGDDYFGPALNRAARVMAAAHGGQILVAASTAALVAPDDLVDLGEHRLRDLSGWHRLYQVRADGLQGEFPPLRTLDASPGNLPIPATSFIGRESELDAIASAVRAHRTVTLTGVGGVGKTRLAVQVGGELAPEFTGGVWLVELADVADPAAVPDAVANALGVTPAAGASMSERVADALGGRPTLLVLDNCEHLLDAVAALLALIHRRGATVHVLATSREGIGIAGEHLWPVPSLPVGGGTTAGAVELFVERARAVVPTFAPEGDEDVILDICRRLDGIALAIELAAARMVSMNPRDVRDRLDDRFRLLSGSRRGLERHQTLRHAVQWSYDLLSEAERTVLNACAVFAGGFDAPAATAICATGPVDGHDVLDALDSLVRKSLVSIDRSAGHARYALLETVRQFAEEQLAQSGARAAMGARHATYYAAEAAVRSEQYCSPRQGESVAWLDAEFANLRSAFGTALDEGDVDAGARIAIFAAIVGAWGFQRWEGVGWAEEVLEPARAARWRHLPILLSAAGMCGFTAGRVDDGIRYGEESVSLADDPTFVLEPNGREWACLAANYLMAGRVDDFRRAAFEGLHRTGDPLVLARCALLIIGDPAASDHDAIVRAARESPWPYGLSYALYGRALARLSTEPAGALADLRESLVAGEDSRSSVQIGIVSLMLGWTEVAHGDAARGLELLRRGLDLFDRGKNEPNTAMVLAVVGLALGRLGDADAGARLWGAGRVIPIPLLWQALEPALAGLKAATAPEFERLTGDGAAMERDDAVELAGTRIDAALAQIRSSLSIGDPESITNLLGRRAGGR
jgi:predicted ATPase